MLLEIAPSKGVEHRLAREVGRRLIETFSPLLTDYAIGPPLELPWEAFNARRGQYLSSAILDSLQRRATDAGRLLGVIDVDLYVPELNFVFGQAQFPGRAAVISLHRLDPAFYGREPDHDLFLGRAFKEGIHEIGHTFGLSHCADRRCVMSFSNSILEVDRKSDKFCGRCGKRLFAR